MSKLKGKLADRGNIVKSGFSGLEKHVIKATRHNTKQPKEKHVRRLLAYSHDAHRVPELIHQLAKRMDVTDWIVVLKTLCVFHRILRDGNGAFISELRYKSSIFNIRKFSDNSSPEAHNQSIFIRKYSQYLEEKVLLFKLVGVEVEKRPESVKAFSAMECLEKLPRLQSQLNALLNTRGAKEYINNSITISAFNMLLKDSFPLYRSLNDGIIILLEFYFNMDKPEALKCIEIYKLFSKETDGMIQFFEMSKRFTQSSLPKLQSAPKTLVDALEKYIEELDSGGPPAGRKKGPHDIISNFTKAQHMDDFNYVQNESEPAGQDSEDSDDEESLANYDKPGNTKYPPTSQSQAQFNYVPQNQFAGSPSGSGNVNDFFSTPLDGFGSNPFGGNTYNSSTPSFDPFPQNTANQQQDYLSKKKQIEMIMQQTTTSTASTGGFSSNTNAGFAASSNQGNGYFDNFGQQQGYAQGYASQSTFQQPPQQQPSQPLQLAYSQQQQQPVYSQQQQSVYSQQQQQPVYSQQHQQPAYSQQQQGSYNQPSFAPAFNNGGYSQQQQQQPAFTSTNPFSSPAQQTQPQQQTQQQPYNPFL
ncbi:ANTH domain-containing protein [Planoprotostelium fungivorum]|uniref:ANTH domain-containing protein n=1 Tax=Planoprotostelium fungivorum TaxID=1890364 RepID=A0A2P6NRA2_9EUKA|nr:ANTH domain-containing protein [Planoprotostelium fungivorum]